VSAKPLPAFNDAPSGCMCATLASRLSISQPALSDRVMDRTLDIANRLRFVCAHLPPEELIELATRMAIIEVKYACVDDEQAELECA
jgi:hypothetical protein